ncbi:7987_t:CDS:1, partial [Rhizophagus irregularis]
HTKATSTAFSSTIPELTQDNGVSLYLSQKKSDTYSSSLRILISSIGRTLRSPSCSTTSI